MTHCEKLIRVARKCWPSNVWTTEVENGTMWHSHINYILQEIQAKITGGIPYEFLYNFPPAEDIHDNIKALSDNLADIDPNLYGTSGDRFQYVDFSVPVGYEEIKIISAKSMRINGQIFEGIFDYPSYGGIVFFLVICGFLLWTFRKKEYSEASLMESGLMTFGLLLKEGIDGCKGCSSQKTKNYIAFIAAIAFFLSTMYECIFISIFSARSMGKKIDSLEDLVSNFASDKKVYLVNNYFPHDLVKSSAFYDQLLPRIDLIEPESIYDLALEIYTNVNKGSHVIIEYESTFSAYFNGILPPEFVCAYPKAGLRLSSYPLASVPSAWIYRK